MIVVRRARMSDAPGIAVVHVAVWRSTYPSILPHDYLNRLSMNRHAMHYQEAIRAGGTAVFVAIASGSDVRPGVRPQVVGFATASRHRHAGPNRLADGEIETLYVLDDYRERGVGRTLMRAAAGALADVGCRSACVWVLRENPNRWFYSRLGGRPVAESMTRVGGQSIPQMAFLWDPIGLLLQASPQES
jgi:ribosomal protein S18 acetylase RimI-like enzyme